MVFFYPEVVGNMDVGYQAAAVMGNCWQFLVQLAVIEIDADTDIIGSEGPDKLSDFPAERVPGVLVGFIGCGFHGDI